jgi:hypothetical protein
VKADAASARCGEIRQPDIGDGGGWSAQRAGSLPGFRRARLDERLGALQARCFSAAIVPRSFDALDGGAVVPEWASHSEIALGVTD